MARVRPQELFDQFNPQMRAALEEALNKMLPDAQVDRRMLYLEFRLALNRKFKQWENVPNSTVDAD
jgi:hypothetical protein